MIPVPSGVRVWLAVGHTDMRRGMNSLALHVQEGLKRDPHAGDLYVFRGKRGHLIKILWHDGIGMSLYATPSGWSAAGFCGRRQPTGSLRSVRRNWPICSTGSTGGTPFALGVQRRLAEGCDALTHPVVERRPGPNNMG
jgi:transposase